MEVLPGRPRENTARMLDDIRAARADGIQMIVFPEMAVPGYLIGDEWERTSFIRECEDCCLELCAASTRLVAIFGRLGVDWKLHNED
jgi:NAD+ synthase (glutamine-hydrolysing)